jgi:nicotinamidase-related amidase
MKVSKMLVLCVMTIVPTFLNAGETTSQIIKGKPALVVIDIQNAYLPYMDEEEVESGLEMINYVIDLFREQGLPVIRVHHTDVERGPEVGSEAFEFPETVRIKADDPIIVKNYPSAFKKTELEKTVQELGCDTVFLAGLSSVGCVLATYFDGLRLDLTTFTVEDALISHRPDLTEAVEEITGAVNYKAIKYMLANARWASGDTQK